jgi:hypothetical protein
MVQDEALPGVGKTAPEGLLLYLTAEESARLLTGIGELSAPGSRLSFEHDSIAASGLLAQARTLPGMGQYAASRRASRGSRRWSSLARSYLLPRAAVRCAAAGGIVPVAGRRAGR